MIDQRRGNALSEYQPRAIARRKPGLDQISLDLMIAGTKAAGVRCTRANVQACAGLQIAIREALRAILPPGDPRRDPEYPFNEPEV